MSEPSPSSAPIGAASSFLNDLFPSETCHVRYATQRAETSENDWEKYLFFLRNSTTSLGFSKRGLPAPSAAKTRGTVKPTAFSNWVRFQFVNIQIIEKIDESGARVEVEEAIDEELQQARCINRNGLFSTKNATHMR